MNKNSTTAAKQVKLKNYWVVTAIWVNDQTTGFSNPTQPQVHWFRASSYRAAERYADDLPFVTQEELAAGRRGWGFGEECEAATSACFANLPVGAPVVH